MHYSAHRQLQQFAALSTSILASLAACGLFVVAPASAQDVPQPTPQPEVPAGDSIGEPAEATEATEPAESGEAVETDPSEGNSPESLEENATPNPAGEATEAIFDPAAPVEEDSPEATPAAVPAESEAPDVVEEAAEPEETPTPSPRALW